MIFFLVILTFAVCMLVDYALRRRRERLAAAAALPAAREEAAPVDRAGYRLPGGVFVHGGHTWAFLTPAGEARVGIDDFARGVMGRIDRIELPLPGAALRQGERAFTVVQGRKRIDLVSPLDGIVASVNREPGALEGDPYQSGWLLAIKPANLAHNLKRLRIAADAAAWLEKETRRFAEFIALHTPRPAEVGVTMQDGGQAAAGALEKVDGELLQIAVKKFFR
ncbi:MAG: glycine cleavage system protein H [Deltaproteobacteria bacterium]